MTSDTIQLQIPHQPFRKAWISQGGGTDLDQGGSNPQVLPDIVRRTDSADADDREAVGAFEHHSGGLKSNR
jgi:hypothetical protein